MADEHLHNPLQQFRFPIGIDCVFEGILNSAVGFEIVLASRAEPIPNFQQTIDRYHNNLDEAGIHLHLTDDDTTTAGLIRAAIRAERSAIALFDIRGFRRAFDTLYEMTRMKTSAGGAAVIVACESRWRELLEPIPKPAPRNLTTATTPPPHYTFPRSTKNRHPRTPADFRELAHYLGLPILAPATPPEVTTYVNEAAHLSQAARQPVLLYLSPALIGGGETPWETADPDLRAITSTVLERCAESTIPPFLEEARARKLDRVLNAPVPGEVAPLGFVTFGTAHATLRHALNILGLKGRIPILKLGHANPIDPHSAEQFLTRCRDVVVVENGEPIIEMQLLAINQKLNQQGINTAQILGDRINLETDLQPQSPQPQTPPQIRLTGVPHHVELNPTELAQLITELLRTRFLKPINTELSTALEQKQLFKTTTGMRHFPTPKRHATADNLWLPVVQTALRELAEQLAIPAPQRPPLGLRIENADTTSFETKKNERVVVLIERRRLVDVGRSVLAHAIRRNLPITFLILPRNPDAPAEPGSAETDRMIRGMVADSEAARTGIGTIDPTDGLSFRKILRREILADTVSILIVDLETHSAPPPARDDQALLETGIPTIEYHLQPASTETTLHFEWLLKRGYTKMKTLDGAHGPKITLPGMPPHLATPLDGWDGFEELRLYRKIPLLAAAELQTEIPQPRIRFAQAAYWHTHIAAADVAEVERIAIIITTLGARMGFRIQLIRGRDRAGAFAQILFSRPRAGQPTDPCSPRIPRGNADLLLVLGAAALREAISPEAGHQVASPGRTAIVFDPGIPETSEIESPAANTGIFSATAPAPSPETAVDNLVTELRGLGFTLESAPLQRACARFFYSREYSAAAFVGFAFQHGLIPATVEAIEKIGRRSHKKSETETRRNNAALIQQALRLGRCFAVDQHTAPHPDASHTPNNPPKAITQQFQSFSTAQKTIKYQHPEQLIKKYCLAISRRKNPWAKQQAEKFRHLAFGTLDAVTRLRHGDPGRHTENELIARIIDCEVWGGIRYARTYADRVRAVYATEVGSTDFEVTRLVITQLAHALIWIDPFFLCAYAVRPNRIRRISRQMRISRANGERLTFRIRTRNQSAFLRTLVGPYWKFTPLTAGIFRHARGLRYLPGMFHHEKHYRRWVSALVDESVAQMPEKRSLYLEAFRQLSRVHGPAPGRWRRASRVRLAVQSLLEIAEPSKSSSLDHEYPNN